MDLDKIMTTEEALVYACWLQINGCPICGAALFEDGTRDDFGKLERIFVWCSNDECVFEVTASTDFENYKQVQPPEEG